MIKRTLGAPLGGTTRGGHHGLDRLALRWITPPSGRSGAGRTSPGIVLVPSGDPMALPEVRNFPWSSSRIASSDLTVLRRWHHICWSVALTGRIIWNSAQTGARMPAVREEVHAQT